jgi:DNA-binding PadR family transcriptional regulator
MILSKKETLEDRLIRLLLEKEQSVKSLNKALVAEGVSVTVQALYKLLRSLVSDEVVIKRANVYALSEEWKERVVERFEQTHNRFELAEGEAITFDLASLVHLDQQWKNIVLPLHNAHPKIPVFFYNPHEIWIHLNESRKQSEYAYYASFTQNKTNAFALFGGATLHDNAMKKELQNEFLQVAVGVEAFAKTDYPTIFGDYIITTRISKRLSEEIEKAYGESATTAELESRLQKIGIEKKKVKLIIERDRDKAKKLRKKLSKEFFVSQELIKEFELY